jgi:hypothetical protein
MRIIRERIAHGWIIPVQVSYIINPQPQLHHSPWFHQSRWGKSIWSCVQKDSMWLGTLILDIMCAHYVTLDARTASEQQATTAPLAIFHTNCYHRSIHALLWRDVHLGTIRMLTQDCVWAVLIIALPALWVPPNAPLASPLTSTST